MIERCKQARFAFEPRHTIGIRHELRGQQFQRHIAPQLGVARAIHFSHTARAQRGDDFVKSEFRAGN